MFECNAPRLVVQGAAFFHQAADDALASALAAEFAVSSARCCCGRLRLAGERLAGAAGAAGALGLTE